MYDKIHYNKKNNNKTGLKKKEEWLFYILKSL